jgi:hypothetical protein
VAVDDKLRIWLEVGVTSSGSTICPSRPCPSLASALSLAAVSLHRHIPRSPSAPPSLTLLGVQVRIHTTNPTRHSFRDRHLKLEQLPEVQQPSYAGHHPRPRSSLSRATFVLSSYSVEQSPLHNSPSCRLIRSRTTRYASQICMMKGHYLC